MLYSYKNETVFISSGGDSVTRKDPTHKVLAFYNYYIYVWIGRREDCGIQKNSNAQRQSEW